MKRVVEQTSDQPVSTRLAGATPSSLAPTSSSSDSTQQFDYFELPRVIQDRVRAFVSGDEPPGVLAQLELPRRGSGLRALVLGGLVLAAAAAFSLGLGELHSSLAMATPAHFVALLVPCIAAAVLGLAWQRQRQRRLQLGFEPRVYLLASGVLDARRPVLEWHSIVDASFEQRGDAIAFRASAGRELVFPMDRDQVPPALAHLTERQQLMSRSLEWERSLSPLAAPQVQSPLQPVEAHRPKLTWWVSHPRMAGVALGVCLAAGGFALRGSVSDPALLESAQRQDTVAAYAAYLDAGGTSPEVEATLLPAAAVREAGNDLDALLEVREHYPHFESPVLDDALDRAVQRTARQARVRGGLPAMWRVARSAAEGAPVRRDVVELLQQHRDHFTQHTGFAEKHPFSVLLRSAQQPVRARVVTEWKLDGEEKQHADARFLKVAPTMDEAWMPTRQLAEANTKAVLDNAATRLTRVLQGLTTDRPVTITDDPASPPPAELVLELRPSFHDRVFYLRAVDGAYLPLMLEVRLLAKPAAGAPTELFSCRRQRITELTTPIESVEGMREFYRLQLETKLDECLQRLMADLVPTSDAPTARR